MPQSRSRSHSRTLPRMHGRATPHAPDDWTDAAIMDEAIRLAQLSVADVIPQLERVCPQSSTVERLRMFAEALTNLAERRARA